jgi:hypothetical protein
LKSEHEIWKEMRVVLAIKGGYSGFMGIFDRLGDVIRSYLNDDDQRVFGRGRNAGTEDFADPDLKAAFDELIDFLGKKRDTPGDRGASAGGSFAGSTGGQGYRSGGAGIPESLRGDFAELGVSFGASADECKAAYKKLLKIHHPDRHAGHAGNMKKATEKSSRINAAYDRIEKWRANFS